MVQEEIKMCIDFYLIDAMEIDNYSPILQALRKRGINAQFVAVPGKANTASTDWFDYENAIRILKEKELPYTTHPNYWCSAAITTQNIDILSPYRGEKIRLMYGVNMFKNAFGNTEHSTIGFDAVLVHGPFSQSIVCQWKNEDFVKIVGFPKYDSFFRGEKNIEKIQKNLKLKPDKKIILYLPTWANKSSIDLFIDDIASLNHNYQVLIKPHHCTARMELDRMKKLRESGSKILDGNQPLDELFSIADIIIVDVSSGAFTEAILTDCRLIGLCNDKNELELNAYSKIYEASPICKNPLFLNKMVDDILLNDEYKEKKALLRDELFSYRNGIAADIAADAIMNHLNKKHTNSKLYIINSELRYQTLRGRRLLNSITKLGIKLIWEAKNEVKCNFFKMQSKFNSTENSVKRSINWLKNNIKGGHGVNISSKNKIPYPEVTGYFIPTLYQWGEKKLARELVFWLIKKQNDDGSFSAPDGTPYSFDTGQVLRGFVAVLDDIPEVRQPLIKACDWLLSQIQPDGRLCTPSTTMWGDVADERIHFYILPPFIEAGKKLNEEKYLTAAQEVLDFYKKRNDLIEFNTISHFYAYIIEALCDLGEVDLARTAMNKVAELQKKNGSVPAYNNVQWVCTPGLAQFAVIWYKLGMKENADNAMEYLEHIQNPSGGFFGCYGNGEREYFPNEEISWAVKYFLDAYYLKIKIEFNRKSDLFSDSIADNDGRLQEIISFFGDINNKKIIDVGSGKGRYLKALKKRCSESEYYAIDLSDEMLKYCPEGTEVKNNSILDIEYPDNFFDCVYSVETLEHAILPENAVKEMVRILKPGGKIIIIDKNAEKLGTLKIEAWEQWFYPQKILDNLKENNVDAKHKPIIFNGGIEPDGLFIVWEGVKT
jgi:malonyl-CoA O-methyltransferase